MKVALAQLNPTIGHFDANTKKILHCIGQAKIQGVDLIIFPELAITGYPPRDLLDDRSFVDRNMEQLSKILEAADGIMAICGYIEKNEGLAGKPYFNSAAVMGERKLIANYRKQLLPYYDVFDEERYFESGDQPCIVTLGEKRIAVTICEDLWNPSPHLVRHYGRDPASQLSPGTMDAIINISASPFSLDKPQHRTDLFASIATSLKAPLFFCNQVGANDELVFDGCSFVLRSNGKLVAKAKGFEEDLLVCSLYDGTANAISGWSYSDGYWIFRALELGIRDYITKCGSRRVLVGLSGGVDSSVCAAIAAKALGPDNVKGICLPTRFTSSQSLEDAEALAKSLGIEFQCLQIEPLFSHYRDLWEKWFLSSPKGLTLENLQPRIRMTILMAVANEEDRLLLSTSNKSEIATGFATLYGDTAGAIAPLGDLTKAQVYQVAKFVNEEKIIIPHRVIDRAPTAELRENQTDEDSLPPYEILDPLVQEHVELGNSAIPHVGLNSSFRKQFEDLHFKSEYKRFQLPPVIRISRRAFGMGRRIPIAAQRGVGLSSRE